MADMLTPVEIIAAIILYGLLMAVVRGWCAAAKRGDRHEENAYKAARDEWRRRENARKSA